MALMVRIYLRRRRSLCRTAAAVQRPLVKPLRYGLDLSLLSWSTLRFRLTRWDNTQFVPDCETYRGGLRYF
jgi:hypothetical protein